jgi:hypothetical protein
MLTETKKSKFAIRRAALTTTEVLERRLLLSSCAYVGTTMLVLGDANGTTFKWRQPR